MPAGSSLLSQRSSSRRRDARHAERGASRLKAIVWVIVLVACFYVGIKVVPVLMDEYEFQDAMSNAARFATVSRQTPDDVRKNLLQEAQKEDLPVRAEDIQVTATNGNVKIDANFSVTVDLQLYQWTLNFHPSASNNAL